MFWRHLFTRGAIPSKRSKRMNSVACSPCRVRSPLWTRLQRPSHWASTIPHPPQRSALQKRAVCGPEVLRASGNGSKRRWLRARCCRRRRSARPAAPPWALEPRAGGSAASASRACRWWRSRGEASGREPRRPRPVREGIRSNGRNRLMIPRQDARQERCLSRRVPSFARQLLPPQGVLPGSIPVRAFARTAQQWRIRQGVAAGGPRPGSALAAVPDDR
jgi:hypothetical protein